MAGKKFWLGILVLALVFGMTVVGCDSGTTSGGGSTILDGTWRRSDNIRIVFSGNTWSFEEPPDVFARGTWRTDSPVTVGSNGTVELTLTYHWDAGWKPHKTNTATYTLNAAGNELSITGATDLTAPYWDAILGVYQKL